MPLYAALADVRFDRIFCELDAIVQAFMVGEPMARERFGPDVQYGGPGWAGISYGHVSCLGSELIFPQGSEVAHTPIYSSLTDGIAALRQEVDWGNVGMMPFYIDLWQGLDKAFPDRNIPFAGFGYEGPITTAWELRGHDFFLDVYDDRERCLEFLALLTDSIVDYARFIRSLNGQPAFLTTNLGLYDDVASMLGPNLWPEVVQPFHKRFFESQTSGPRYAHIENLTTGHLPLLKALALDHFDPSVSPKLRPSDLRDRCQMPFLWRLNAMHVRDLDDAQIRHFVYDAVADGASGVFCNIARTMTAPEDVSKIHTFIDAAKRVEKLLAQGCPRERLHSRTLSTLC
jgi:hypothetical protein